MRTYTVGTRISRTPIGILKHCSESGTTYDFKTATKGLGE